MTKCRSKYGYHIAKEQKEYSDRIKIESERKDLAIPVKAVQIFVAKTPRSMEISLTYEQCEAIKQVIEDNNLFGISHGTYYDSLWGKYPKFILKEMKVAKLCGFSGSIIHLNSKTCEETADGVRKLFELKDKIKGRLVLESAHVSKDKAYHTDPSDIGELFDLFDESMRKRHLGFCFDTAHLWASGCDISTKEKADVWIDEFKDMLDVPVTCHLNDSYEILGRGKDKHAPLGSGNIWSFDSPKNTGLLNFIELTEASKIPVILERSDLYTKDKTVYADDLLVIKNILKKIYS